MKKLLVPFCLTLIIFIGSVGMSTSADLQKGLTAFKSGDSATALREWKPLAEQGNAVAQKNMSVLHNNGLGVPKDDKTAVKWYRLAAEQGNLHAQMQLGAKYALGQGVPKDYVRADMWYIIAESNGDKHATKDRDIVTKQMTPPQLEKAQDLARECVRKKYKGC